MVVQVTRAKAIRCQVRGPRDGVASISVLEPTKTTHTGRALTRARWQSVLIDLERITRARMANRHHRLGFPVGCRRNRLLAAQRPLVAIAPKSVFDGRAAVSCDCCGEPGRLPWGGALG